MHYQDIVLNMTHEEKIKHRAQIAEGLAKLRQAKVNKHPLIASAEGEAYAHGHKLGPWVEDQSGFWSAACFKCGEYAVVQPLAWLKPTTRGVALAVGCKPEPKDNFLDNFLVPF